MVLLMIRECDDAGGQLRPVVQALAGSAAASEKKGTTVILPCYFTKQVPKVGIRNLSPQLCNIAYNQLDCGVADLKKVAELRLRTFKI